MKLGHYSIQLRPTGLVVPGLFFAFALYQYVYISRLPDSDINLVLIRPAFILMIVFTVWVIARNTTIKRIDAPVREEAAPAGVTQKKKVLFFLIMAGLYMGLMPFAGFILCNLIFIPLCMRFLGENRRTLLVALPLAATAFIVIVFQMWLEIPLPEGLLGFFFA